MAASLTDGQPASQLASMTARLSDSLTVFMTGSLKDARSMMAMLN